MSGTVKNIVMLVVLVGVAGLAGWFFVRGDPEKKLPDTAESATQWMCTQCKKELDLTARQVDEWRKSPDKIRRDPNFDGAQIVFWCEDCKKFSVVRAFECPEHHVWFWPRDEYGREGNCPECAKGARP